MFRKLLIPLDRSPLAEQAIGQAAAIARASKAEMDLVLVHQPFPFDGFDDAPWNSDSWNQERQYLEAIGAEISTGSSVPVTHAILRGEVVDMICRHIGDVHADLVVMTSHGRTGLSRAWMGSAADGVLRHSTAPVLILRPIEGKTRRNAAHHLFKRVLVPVDGSALSTEVFAAATALAKCSGARLSLLRVVQPIPLISADASMPYAYTPTFDEPATKRMADEAKEQLDEIMRRLGDESGVEIDAQIVVEPRIGPAILDFARVHDIDVIAMSTHGRGMSRFLLGSVADKVLRGSGLPMLLYRPSGVQARVHIVETSADADAPAVTHT
jgi:nucleotide-binding universal stress UspA family protein